MSNTKYIFITGGVLSSLGKGIATASIGNILESYGFSVTAIKLDPYLNVDPGTMSPFQHGEVFVTDDGAETDLDLGHYERFISSSTTQESNCTAGQIYFTVIEKERRGEYLGNTVQVIPHITDEIKAVISEADGKFDVILVEIGGTVGDIESQPFLEAIRQMDLEREEKSVLFTHLTLVPYLKAAGELKTKPTQHSVKALREIGIQPDILICRADVPIPTDIKKKIGLFTNLREQDIISAPDVDSIYEIPMIFEKEGLGNMILKKLKLEKQKDDSSLWFNWVKKCKELTDEVTISIVGKYISMKDTYKSLYEALYHAGVANSIKVNLDLVESDHLLEWNLDEVFDKSNAVLVPGGFGLRGIEGMIKAITHAREKQLPFLGICLGMQMACIEFARNVAGFSDAHSSEFNSKSTHKIFLKLKELTNVEDLGGNMRLGQYGCILKKQSKIHEIYNHEIILERHRHRYEFNPEFETKLEEHGMLISGKNPERDLVEVVELKDHPWFIGCQYHPEFKSRPLTPHPLFVSFVEAAIRISKQN